MDQWQGGIGGVAGGAPTGPGAMGGGQMPQQVNAVPQGAPQMPVPVTKNAVGIFCNNLAWSVGGEELKSYFLNNGFCITDAQVAYFPDGRSKGWGIVNLENDADVPNAVAQLNNTMLNVRINAVYSI
jgi:hypothetical protein